MHFAFLWYKSWQAHGVLLLKFMNASAVLLKIYFCRHKKKVDCQEANILYRLLCLSTQTSVLGCTIFFALKSFFKLFMVVFFLSSWLMTCVFGLICITLLFWKWSISIMEGFTVSNFPMVIFSKSAFLIDFRDVNK